MTAPEPAGVSNALSLSRLHARTFAQGWTAPFFRSLLDSHGTFAFVVRKRMRTLEGFILARVAADEAEILTLAVAPEARRRGHARALVDAAARHAAGLGANAMFLEVDSENSAARALYAGMAFREVGKRPAYYRDAPNEPARDALTLRAELPLGKALGIG